MDISIVSGTYNRLTFLQRMVASARASLGGVRGLRHEFVLVDGGSQDKTQIWCREQPDVRLIEHGKLKGAVKAFNDGAYAAGGHYVVLANDDVEFIGDTVYLGWAYMQDHPDCGVGCFYQDRNRRSWHVEDMPVVRDGKQASAPYGQVCIVPKWLGDHVGWWGDYLHTYGGDNELSARVYELGFKVSPVPETKIHDNEADDDLRRINNITGGKDPRAVRGHHPDSWAWGRRWRRRGLVGPVIKDEPAFENPVPKRDRVVYLPIFEQGWEVQKAQKRGLREALAKRAVVAEFDYMSRNAEVGQRKTVEELGKLCHFVKPTVLLTQLHDSNIVKPGDLDFLRNAAPGCKFVNWNGDFWPDNLLSEAGIELAKAFDLQTTINRDALETYWERGVNAAYWQIGYEPDGVGHDPDGGTPRHDIVFLGNGYSPARKGFVRNLRALNGLDFGLYGQGWPDGWAHGQCLYDFVTACRLYRGAKISLGDSQWPETGFVSNRVFQALAAGGAVLAHQWFRGMDELGLVDGETVVVWKDFGELREKLQYYLSHEDERRRIAEAGERLALERHSFDARVGELFEMLRGGEEEWWR